MEEYLKLTHDGSSGDMRAAGSSQEGLREIIERRKIGEAGRRREYEVAARVRGGLRQPRRRRGTRLEGGSPLAWWLACVGIDFWEAPSDACRCLF